MSEVAIGIDLGTSNSAVSIVRDGQVEVLPNSFGERIMASAVGFREDGNILVGNEAKANVVNEPASTVTSAKRLIGRYFFSEEVKKAQVICPYTIVEGPEHSVRIQVREEVFSLPEISAMILRELKCVAESHLGHEVKKAVITVPAYFNDNQRQATKDAGKIAGLDVLRILNEPTAAALAYGFGQGLTQKVAVWDLGGGTFDISVLEIGEDVFEVISTSGDTFLGGDDFDDRLIDLLADEFQQAHGQNLRQDPHTFERLKLAAENAKKQLSVEDTVRIEIPEVAKNAEGNGLSVSRELTADDFSKLTHDLIQRTFKVCDEALQQAGVLARELDGVVLVGGPTRLPVIKEAVKAYFQMEPKTDVDPDVVVAMGAAIHASELVAPQQQAFLLDVTPLSLQVGVAGGFCEPVIERNTPVPIEQSRSFTTVQDDQETVVIRVYQGEAKVADENELLGQFEFSGFPRARRGQVEIQVTFAINSDGIVDVTASEPETGQVASTRITLSSGLSEAELQSILEENRTDRVLTEMVARAEDAAVPAAEPLPGVASTVAAATATAAREAAASAPLGEASIDLECDDDGDVPELEVDDGGNVPELEVDDGGGVPELEVDDGGNVPDLEVDDGGNVPDLEVDSDLSEADMDALIEGSDEEMTQPSIEVAPAAAPVAEVVAEPASAVAEVVAEPAVAEVVAETAVAEVVAETAPESAEVEIEVVAEAEAESGGNDVTDLFEAVGTDLRTVDSADPDEDFELGS